MNIFFAAFLILLVLKLLGIVAIGWLLVLLPLLIQLGIALTVLGVVGLVTTFSRSTLKPIITRRF